MRDGGNRSAAQQHHLIREERRFDARRALVTGCAGFIGSQLAERLCADGWEVVGVDGFTPFYDRALKERNLERLRREAGFVLHELDLARDELEEPLEGTDAVFHLAGEPGVRQSFEQGAEACVRNNVRATARLMTAAARRPGRPLVFASSSTVYGDALRLPTPEATPLRPISPCGRTKVATEAVARIIAERTGLVTVGQRYVSAYGPRQRPDMAFSRFLERALAGRPVPVHGSGEQRRDFTYVGDLVDATVRAAGRGRPGRVYNVGGGTPATVLQTLGLLERLVERQIEIEWTGPPPGDARSTCADASLARGELGFAPTTTLAQGLASQVEWALDRRGAGTAVAV